MRIAFVYLLPIVRCVRLQSWLSGQRVRVRLTRDEVVDFITPGVVQVPL